MLGLSGNENCVVVYVGGRFYEILVEKRSGSDRKVSIVFSSEDDILRLICWYVL